MKDWGQILALAVLLAVVSPVAPAGAQQGAADLPTRQIGQTPGSERLAEVERFLEGLQTMQARFVQQAPDGSIARGLVQLERPGRIRFEYTDGTPLLLVSDGKVLTFVDYDVGQVSRWPVEDTPLHLLVAEDVDLADNASIVASGPGRYANHLTVTAQDPKRPEKGTLIMEFERREGGGLSLLGWQVIDAKGYVTRIRLEDMRTDVALEDRLWSFNDPRGLDNRRRRRR